MYADALTLALISCVVLKDDAGGDAKCRGG